MGRGFNSGKPWIGSWDWCSYQIGQCRLHINKVQTAQYYSTLPMITDNCKCDYCKHFQYEVINRPNMLFKLLKNMHVDISRQPKDPNIEVCCIGEAKPGKLGYMGSYLAYGIVGKTSKSTASKDNEGQVKEVTFNNVEFGKNMHVSITQIDTDKISFSFYIETDANL